MYLSNEELYSIQGGAVTLGGLNAVCRFIDTMLGLEDKKGAQYVSFFICFFIFLNL